MSLNKKNILIAEDEKPYARALVLKLQHAGFNASSVEDGEQAIDILSKEKFDLIFLDLIMPKKNGFAVLLFMKENHIKIPTIVISNLSQPDDEKKARDLGAIDFLNKSNTSIAEVIKKVDSLIKK